MRKDFSVVNKMVYNFGKLWFITKKKMQAANLSLIGMARFNIQRLYIL